MIFKTNEKVPVDLLASLRESVGWNRMEKELSNPKMTSYYLKGNHIYMISVLFDESLKFFYEKFGFYTMLSGQMETEKCKF